MMKYRLFAPGPTAVSEEANLTMARPILHHRTQAFEKVIAEVREGLKWLYQTRNDVVFFASSGTGAMEAAVTNLFSRGDRVVVVDGGKFGERWWKICQTYGLETDIIKVDWGSAVDPSEIEKRVRGGHVKGVLVQASESSTGVYHPIEEISKITRRSEALLVVDAISALVACDLPMDKWGIDVMIGGSQKGVGLPPGLSFIGLSERAWKLAGQSSSPRFYFDLRRERENLAKNQSAFTPAITLLRGLAATLRTLKEEGIPEIFTRHARLAEATRAGVRGLELKLFAKNPVNSLTAVRAPDGIDGQKIYKILQDRYNLTIAGGQDSMKGKIFRIAHLGYYDDLDVITVLAALEWTLADLGYRFELGSGLKAAMEKFREWQRS